MENIDKITSSSHILLPICCEGEGEDVFLNVLKNIFSRSKYDHSFYDDAFKFGMSGEVFPIEEEDLSVDWKILNSIDQRTRQSKLLGFWSIENFPSLGKQLCGSSWRAKSKSLQTINYSKEISVDEINKLVFKKLKLRVLQLYVSDSTLGKLKFFVNVPDTIPKRNESKVSRKIKAFDIDDQWIEHCWKALKLGGFSLAFEHQQRDQIQTLNLLESLPDRVYKEQTNGENGSLSVALKRTYLDIQDFNVNGSNSITNGDTSIGFPPIQAPKRACMDIVDVNVNDRCHMDINDSRHSQPVLTALSNGNAMCTNGSNIDVQSAILNLRNEFGRVTDLIQLTLQERQSEIPAGQERKKIVINQKDAEIAQLKDIVQQLRKENDSLLKDQLQSVEKIETQAAAMNVLQQGADTNLKLQEELGEWKRYSDSKEQELKNAHTALTDTATTKQNLMKELNVVNQANEKLRDEVNTLKTNTASLMVELKQEIETLEASVVEAERVNCETNDQKLKLQEELGEWKRYTDSKEQELKNAHTALTDTATTKQNLIEELNVVNGANEKLRDEVNTLKTNTASLMVELKQEIETLEASVVEAERVNCETNDQNLKLQEELGESKRYTDSKEQELKNAHTALTDTATTKQNLIEELNVVNGANEKLRDEVNTLKTNTASLMVELKQEIETLEASVVEAERVNCETNDQKLKLQEELGEWKRYTDSKEQELKNAHTALTDTATTKQNLIEELNVVNQANEKLRDEVNTLKTNSSTLVINCNAREDKLQEELDTLKYYTVSKEYELENTLKSLNELRKQTDSPENQKSDVGTQTATCNEIKEISFGDEMSGIEPKDIQRSYIKPGEINDIEPNDRVKPMIPDGTQGESGYRASRPMRSVRLRTKPIVKKKRNSDK